MVADVSDSDWYPHGITLNSSSGVDAALWAQRGPNGVAASFETEGQGRPQTRNVNSKFPRKQITAAAIRCPWLGRAASLDAGQGFRVWPGLPL